MGISFLDGFIDVAARLTLYSGLKMICISKPDCVADTTVTYPTPGRVTPDLSRVLAIGEPQLLSCTHLPDTLREVAPGGYT